MKQVCLTVLLAACGEGTPPQSPIEPAPPIEAVRYEVHEWGLARGTANDAISLSGPHVEPMPMPVAKPVLYFHREGEGALRVTVTARIPGGRIVEHWPHTGATGAEVTWTDVMIQDGACRGGRFPTMGEPPCAGLAECEAATLASVETQDADCVYWPRPPDDDGPTEAWNHLFYRGEITHAPSLPLRVEPQPDGSLRVTSIGERVVGRLIRVRRTMGIPGAGDAVVVADPPARGASVVIAAPSRPMSEGIEALDRSLRDAGLTADETRAFRNAWDEAIFGTTAPAAAYPATEVTTVLASPVAPTTSLLYVLPASSADALATLTFDPPPATVKRAIVMWIDEARAP